MPPPPEGDMDCSQNIEVDSDAEENDEQITRLLTHAVVRLARVAYRLLENGAA